MTILYGQEPFEATLSQKSSEIGFFDTVFLHYQLRRVLQMNHVAKAYGFAPLFENERGTIADLGFCYLKDTSGWFGLKWIASFVNPDSVAYESRQQLAAALKDYHDDWQAETVQKKGKSKRNKITDTLFLAQLSPSWLKTAVIIVLTVVFATWFIVSAGALLHIPGLLIVASFVSKPILISIISGSGFLTLLCLREWFKPGLINDFIAVCFLDNYQSCSTDEINIVSAATTRIFEQFNNFFFEVIDTIPHKNGVGRIAWVSLRLIANFIYQAIATPFIVLEALTMPLFTELDVNGMGRTVFEQDPFYNVPCYIHDDTQQLSYSVKGYDSTSDSESSDPSDSSKKGGGFISN